MPIENDVDNDPNDRPANELQIGINLDAQRQPTGHVFIRLPEYGIIVKCDLDDALSIYFALSQAIEAASPAFKASTKDAN